MAVITVTVAGATVVVGNNDIVNINIPGGGEVTIVADPTENVRKFTVRFLDDTEADTANIDLSTFSANDLQIDIKQYDPTDSIQLQGAFNQYVDPDNVREFSFDYIGADGQTYSSYVNAKDGGEKDFTSDPAPIIICFTAGTVFETRNGHKAIEDLQLGDEVRTLDSGFSAVRWLGCTSICAAQLRAWPDLLPVRVKKDAFGLGRPDRDVVLSPNHRILIDGWRAQLHFGEAEILVPAKSLVDNKSIFQDTDFSDVSYYHLLLENHEIVLTHGLLSESLFLGDQTMIALGAISKLELRASFSQVEWHHKCNAPAARPIARVRDSACLAA
jgi:hypothetical protein